MKLLVKNILLPRNGATENTDIYITDGVITAIGTEPKGFVADEILDGEGRLAIPAFVNSHTHDYMTVLRGIADDMPFMKWLFEGVMPREEKLNREQSYWSALLGCAEMIKRGTGTFLDMHIIGGASAQAAIDSGMRACVSRGLVGSEGGQRRLDEQLAEMQRLGIRAFYILPEPKNFRPDSMPTNLSPDYLSEEFFELCAYAIDKGTSQGMKCWIYDEGGWPSGGACGKVVKDRPEYSSGGNYPDLLNRDATEYFIEITHKKYASITRKFSAVFTDEPKAPSNPFNKDLADKYEQLCGESILPYLTLIENKEKPTEENVHILRRWYDLCSHEFCENFLFPCKKWANENGFAFTGHLDKDHSSHGCMNGGGNFNLMRALRCFDIPGVDVIWRQLYPENKTENINDMNGYKKIKQQAYFYACCLKLIFSFF